MGGELKGNPMVIFNIPELLIRQTAYDFDS